MRVYSRISLLFLFCCLLNPESFSQSYFFGTGVSQAGPCKYDSSVTIQSSSNWEVYQTQNDRWDGEIDSSRCISFKNSKINVADIDPQKPVFVRYIMPTPNFHILWKNQLWANRYSPLSISGNTTFLLADSTCPDQLCTSVRMGIEIPDSAGTGTDIRWYSGNFARDPITFETGFCFPSEKFETQLIKEIYIRFQLDQVDSSSTIIVPTLQVEEQFGYSLATSFTAISTFPMPPSVSVSFPILMLHNDSTYPTIHNPYFIDVNLSPPSNRQETIFLNIEPFGFLTGQPFTELRGDTVEGGNGLRHQVVVVNRGGTMCFFFLEVIFRQGNGYRHESGKISFQHPSGCMAFHSGSFLEVADGQKMDYGNDPLGVLLLREGAEVRLGKQAELRIANRLVLDAVTEEGNVHIYLPPGRKLSFAASSRILIGGKSANPRAKLIVHLRGGELDDSELSASSRKHILRIEEGQLAHSLQSAGIRYSANGESPFVHLICDEKMSLELSLLDLNGRILWNESLQLDQGARQISLPVAGLAPAMYLLRLSDGEAVVGRKLLLR